MKNNNKEKKLKKKKEQYFLHTPEEHYTMSYPLFYAKVMDLGADNPELNKQLLAIQDSCIIKLPHKKEDVYPCPVCGELSLYAGNFGEMQEFPEYKITCSNCDFIAPTELTFEENSAWTYFHAWLVKEGYLKKK